MAVWWDACPQIFLIPTCTPLWLWSKRDDDLSSLCTTLASYGTLREGGSPILWYNEAARQCLTAMQHQRLFALFQKYGTAQVPMPETPRARHILVSLRVPIERALADTALGKWAQRLQYSVPYRPYT